MSDLRKSWLAGALWGVASVWAGIAVGFGFGGVISTDAVVCYAGFAVFCAGVSLVLQSTISASPTRSSEALP
jgi:hypothetical protein